MTKIKIGTPINRMRLRGLAQIAEDTRENLYQPLKLPSDKRRPQHVNNMPNSHFNAFGMDLHESGKVAYNRYRRESWPAEKRRIAAP